MKQILLTRDKVALVSDEDYERINATKWIAQHSSTQSTWYAVKSGNPWVSMHRFILNARSGVVLHLNDDGLDNRRENLLLADNSANQHLRFKDAKGYHWEASRGKWKAMICIDSRRIYLGRFDTEEEAAEAYRNAKERILRQLTTGESGGQETT